MSESDDVDIKTTGSGDNVDKSEHSDNTQQDEIEGGEEACNLDTTDEIGHSTDLNDSNTESNDKEHNASTDAVHSDQETVEEDLEAGDESPEMRNSSLRIQENGHDENGGDKNGDSSPVPPPVNAVQDQVSKMHLNEESRVRKPVDIRPVHIGDMKIRSKLKFEVVTAKVVEEGGKKFVAYTIMLKRASGDPHPALVHRRYNDFYKLYERIVNTFHKSVLGDFQFPQKVIRNFKAEVISERTDAFHRFLNLIANNDKLLYSDYFHAFMCTEEQNEAVSYIKLGRFHEAAPLLETIFYIREKMFTLSHICVLECVVELVACLAAVKSDETAYRYALIASQCIQLSAGHPFLTQITVPFLKLAESLADSVGHDPKPYKKQISELRYSGVKTDRVPTLLEVVRDKYIHTATKTARAY